MLSLPLDQYPFYFRDDSKMILPQAGEYNGADGIEEYVRFATSSTGTT